MIQSFQNAPQSFKILNPHIFGQSTPKNDVQVNVERKRGIMNKTEQEFSLILEAMKRKGEILRYEYEGITLRFSGVKYTPDFVVFCTGDPNPYNLSLACPKIGIKFIEVKGPFIHGNRERAVERFRHAKTYWRQCTFELHQRTKQGWKQLI